VVFGSTHENVSNMLKMCSQGEIQCCFIFLKKGDVTLIGPRASFPRPSQKPAQALVARSRVAPAPASPEPVTAMWRTPTSDEGRPTRLRPRQEACPDVVQERLPFTPRPHALPSSSLPRVAEQQPGHRLLAPPSPPAPPWHAVGQLRHGMQP
jgi:hypothetical protein